MSLLTNIPDKAWKNKGKDYGRKPYIKGKIGDYREMMDVTPQNAVFNAMKERYGVFEPQSEFKKPYLGVPDYQAMEYAYSPPDPISFIPPGRIPDAGELRDLGSLGSETKGLCVIVCYGDITTGESCEKGVGECHVSVAWFKDVQVYTDGQEQYEWSVSGPYKEIKYFKDALGTKPKDKGESGGSSIEIYPDWDNIEADANNQKTAEFDVTLTDGLGHVCTSKSTVLCTNVCACPSDIAYDAGNPETIAREANATITITGGCAPYTWAVAGTGFSFPPGTTTALTNTLSADATACGTATITVTDACGTTATGYVRCTTGEWSAWDTAHRRSSVGCGDSVCGETAHSREIISGKDRWLFGTGGGYENQCSNATCRVWSNPGVETPEPPCGSPYGCWDGGNCPTCTGVGKPNPYFHLCDYYDWVCA